MSNSRKCDVYFEPALTSHGNREYFFAWTDEDMEEVIASTPGIIDVTVDKKGFRYTVYDDPRYDRSELLKEIEAKVKAAMRERGAE